MAWLCLPGSPTFGTLLSKLKIQDLSQVYSKVRKISHHPSLEYAIAWLSAYALEEDRPRFQSHLYHIRAVLFLISYLNSLSLVSHLQNRDENS